MWWRAHDWRSQWDIFRGLNRQNEKKSICDRVEEETFSIHNTNDIFMIKKTSINEDKCDQHMLGKSRRSWKNKIRRKKKSISCRGSQWVDSEANKMLTFNRKIWHWARFSFISIRFLLSSICSVWENHCSEGGEMRFNLDWCWSLALR